MGASTSIVGSVSASIIAAQCVGPDIGTKVQAADVNGALESIENDLAAIRYTISPALPVLRTLHGAPFSFTGTWTFDATANGVWVDTGTSGDIAYFSLDLPHATIVTDISATISPVVAGRAGLVAVPPHLDIVQVPIATGTPASQTQSDTTASVVLYEALHEFTLIPTKTQTAWAGGQTVIPGDFRKNGGLLFMCISGGVTDVAGTGPSVLVAQTVEPIGGVAWTFASVNASAYTIDRRLCRYFLRFVGENGANAVADLKLIGLRSNYTIVRLSQDG